MKKLSFLLLIFSTIFLSAQTITSLDSTIWDKDYSVAMTKVKESGKPLLMVFSGSDWCKPCIMLRERIFITPDFSAWAKQNVVCVCLDFPSQKKNKLPQVLQQQNDALAERFNPNGLFPLVVIVDKNENILGTLGYHDVLPDEYIAELEKLINIK